MEVGDSNPFRTGHVYRTTRFSRNLCNLEGQFLVKRIAYLMSSRCPYRTRWKKSMRLQGKGKLILKPLEVILHQANYV